MIMIESVVPTHAQMEFQQKQTWPREPKKQKAGCHDFGKFFSRAFSALKEGQVKHD